MVILLGHLATQPLAGKTVTEMLNKNMEIQEDEMSEKEFEIKGFQLKFYVFAIASIMLFMSR